MGKQVLQFALLAVGLFIAWRLAQFALRLWWPAKLSPELTFRHELSTTMKLREVAEALAKRFGAPAADNVVCLGPVRGNAARVLFHSGPDNPGTNVNIHRADYVLHVKRLSDSRVALELALNHPYSYVRLNLREVEPLLRALRETYGRLTEV
jgi:hypothetical protein